MTRQRTQAGAVRSRRVRSGGRNAALLNPGGRDVKIHGGRDVKVHGAN